MRKYLIAVVACVLLGGCSLIEIKSGTEKAADVTPVVGEVAGNLVADIEEATGKDFISDDTAEVWVDRADTVADVAGKARTGLKVAEGFLPEKWKNFAGVADGTFYLLLTGALSLAEFMRRQKKKVAQAAVLGADSVSGGGKALVKAATTLGVADDVASTHRELQKTGAAESK